MLADAVRTRSMRCDSCVAGGAASAGGCREPAWAARARRQRSARARRARARARPRRRDAHICRRTCAAHTAGASAQTTGTRACTALADALTSPQECEGRSSRVEVAAVESSGVCHVKAGGDPRFKHPQVDEARRGQQSVAQRPERRVRDCSPRAAGTRLGGSHTVSHHRDR